MPNPDSDDLLKRLEERALESAAEEILVPEIDLREALGLEGSGAPAPDLTLGGYIAEHDRPPAFEGSDGQPYTVAIEVEETGNAARPFVAFLIFVRWAATGAGIMEHVESDDVATGTTENEAEHAALDLSLFEVKAALDQAIARRKADLEDDHDTPELDSLPE
jgi:hypothetical protein